ncbi:MAG: hypothetical protein JXI32_05675 [Deltaproteobacteria bacterium]|nr:hypothetical protein [Deltaproteobacteria bacterium]
MCRSRLLVAVDLMFKYEHILTQPLFFLFVAFSFLLTLGYFWGRRQNREIFLSAFNNLMEVFRPDDQTFTNIGGAIGYHANLFIRKKGAFLSRVDATITMLPRHSWLYLPVSKLIRKYDRLFIELYVKNKPEEECHIIEERYARFAGARIAGAERLNRETVAWGAHTFHLYYETIGMHTRLMDFIDRNPEPGTIRHIAIVPNQKKCFIFMIPRKGQVARDLSPVYRWLSSVVKKS